MENKKFMFLTILITIVIISMIIKPSSEKRVIHIGVDGVLQTCLKKAKHSVFDEFEEQCSYTYKARSTIQATSAPGWSNILCGIDSEMSGVTNNNWIAPWNFGSHNPITPFTGNDTPFPCIFENIKKQDPNKKIAYFTDWDWFINLSNSSIPGNYIDIDEYCRTEGEGNTAEKMAVCENNTLIKIKDLIKNKNFDYIFFYIGQIDEEGHASGFCSDEYIKRLTLVNNIIESIIASLKVEGLWDNDTYIVWNTDHGADIGTTYHGKQNDDNILVPYFVCGKGIKKGYEITKPVKNLDTPATISHILDLQSNDKWKGRVISEIFDSSFYEMKQNLKSLK